MEFAEEEGMPMGTGRVAACLAGESQEQGMKNVDVANALNISKRCVTHVYSYYRKNDSIRSS